MTSWKLTPDLIIAYLFTAVVIDDYFLYSLKFETLNIRLQEEKNVINNKNLNRFFFD